MIGLANRALAARCAAAARWQHHAVFIESYFSNYIEGTEFEIEEAHDIVTKRMALQCREDDSHDLIGTFNAILDSVARPTFPTSLESFRGQLRSWNSQVLFSRSSRNPRRWKEKPNRVGGTQFVAPDLVPGTLAKGFELIAQMQNPAAKAALAMLVVLEVHPFSDGNGRTARCITDADARGAVQRVADLRHERCNV